MENNSEKEVTEAYKRMTDLLVQTGIASKAVFNEATNTGGGSLTPDGIVFKRQLLKMYDQLAKNKGKEGMSRLLEVLTFLITQR